MSQENSEPIGRQCRRAARRRQTDLHNEENINDDDIVDDTNDDDDSQMSETEGGHAIQRVWERVGPLVFTGPRGVIGQCPICEENLVPGALPTLSRRRRRWRHKVLEMRKT